MPKKTVMVVEDDEVYRELLVLGLALEGFEAIPAENGAVAADLLQNHTPDVLLVDMLMPVMDGLRFLHWLKNEAKLNIPNLVITCLDGRSIAVDALVAGASDVLIKPITLEALVDKIATVA